MRSAFSARGGLRPSSGCDFSQGQLGYGNNRNVGDAAGQMPPRNVPVRYDEDTAVVTQLSAGGSHTCSLNTRHELRCWGHGADGQLGIGSDVDVGYGVTPTIRLMPPNPSLLNASVLQV